MASKKIQKTPTLKAVASAPVSSTESDRGARAQEEACPFHGSACVPEECTLLSETRVMEERLAAIGGLAAAARESLILGDGSVVGMPTTAALDVITLIASSLGDASSVGPAIDLSVNRRVARKAVQWVTMESYRRYGHHVAERLAAGGPKPVA